MEYLWTRGVRLVGDAKNVIPNTDHPTNGWAVKLKYGEIYHAAYIENTYPTFMEISEWNFKKCQYTKRFLGYDDYAIVGYVMPIKGINSE